MMNFKWKLKLCFIAYSINWPPFTIMWTPDHYGLVSAAPLITHNSDSPDCHLPSACLCCLLCLLSLLTLCSLCCMAADMLRKQAEGSLSFFLSPPPSLSLSLCHSPLVPLAHLFTSSNKQSPGWWSPPMWQFVTLCQPVECHWENITSPNVALCDTAFDAEKSAACKQLQGTLPHGCMSEKPRAKSKRKNEGRMSFVCVGG